MINYEFYFDACIAAAQGHNNKRFYINELYAVRSVIPWETMLLWHVEGMRVWVTAELVSACDSVCDRKWGIIVTIPQILSIQDIYTSLTFTHTLSRHCYTHTHTQTSTTHQPAILEQSGGAATIYCIILQIVRANVTPNTFRLGIIKRNTD